MLDGKLVAVLRLASHWPVMNWVIVPLGVIRPIPQEPKPPPPHALSVNQRSPSAPDVIQTG